MKTDGCQEGYDEKNYILPHCVLFMQSYQHNFESTLIGNMPSQTYHYVQEKTVKHVFEYSRSPTSRAILYCNLTDMKTRAQLKKNLLFPV